MWILDGAKAKLRDALPSLDIDAVRRVIDAIPHPIFIKDDEYRFVVVNQSMCEFMGRSFSELIGRTDRDFVPAADADLYQRNDRLVLDSGKINENEESLTAAGEVRTVLTRKKRICLPDGARLVVGCISDITGFRLAEAQIRHNAEHDHLTGLANRALFQAELRRASANACDRPADLAVALIDLDGFKNINDAYGHAAGDAVLVHISSVLAKLAGPGDLVARLGGDEFAILCRQCEQGQAAAFAAAAVEHLSQAIPLQGSQVHVSASIGLALGSANQENAEDLMRQADLALYSAKQAGKNTWRMFDAAMEAVHLAARFLEDDLRRAVAGGEFALAYQPLVRLPDRQLIGFEVLLRWNSADRGPVSPALFVPVAERLGLIRRLGEFVLREACGEAAQWPEPCRVAVNVSPVQFEQRDLPDIVQAIFGETGIDPHRVELEITETAVMRDLARARRTCDTLRRLGARIVLDDFGVGYSSLQMLKSLPFDKIKIDRSLLEGVGASPEADTIVGAIIGLAHSLGLQVAAEGVETEAQLAILRREGCHEAQGFLIGKPAPMAVHRRLFSATELTA